MGKKARDGYLTDQEKWITKAAAKDIDMPEPTPYDAKNVQAQYDAATDVEPQRVVTNPSD